MTNNKGFVLIELLVESLAVTGLLAVGSLLAAQLFVAVTSVSASREEALYEAMAWDLENLGARQAIYFADELAYSTSPGDLGFRSSEGVAVEIVVSPDGWTGTATHATLDSGEGCAVYFGDVHPPTSPVRPPRPGVVTCTG